MRRIPPPPAAAPKRRLASSLFGFLHGSCWLIAAAVATVVHAQVDPPAPYLQTPSARQLEWHGLEYYAFVHFGPNTFTDEEWGRSQSPPDVFAPTALDTDQWARALADAGAAGLILTAKHHDGMALVSKSPRCFCYPRWLESRH